MNEVERFEREKKDSIEKLGASDRLKELTLQWFVESCRLRYSYNFAWLGRPIIQFPQDIVAMQEIIWSVQPDLIVETGIAHGGSLIFYASMLELLGGEDREVIGIDIDIRAHNRREIERHPMSRRLRLIEGSSTEEATVDEVKKHLARHRKVMVVLDSSHTHDHVLRELDLYSPMVTNGSYLIVFDTVIEDMPEDFFDDRPWGKGNNGKTAVAAFLAKNDRFVIDADIQHKLLITVAPDGYLRCVKD
jgi:cephalosporin hydroxylase